LTNNIEGNVFATIFLH